MDYPYLRVTINEHGNLSVLTANRLLRNNSTSPEIIELLLLSSLTH